MKASTPEAFMASIGFHSSPGVDKINREISAARPRTAGSRRATPSHDPNTPPVMRPCRSGLMIRLVSEVKTARHDLDLVLDEANSMEDDVKAAFRENQRLKASIRAREGEVNASKIKITQLRRKRNELKAKLEEKEVAHKTQMHTLQKELYKAEAKRKKAEGMSSDFGKTSKKFEKERNFYRSKMDNERETAEVLEEQAERLKNESQHTVDLMKQHDDEWADTKVENDFLQKHLDIRKNFQGTWYELNMYDLIMYAKDSVAAELKLRMRIQYYDEPFRKTYARILRLQKERGMSVFGWERVCRDCQVMGGVIDSDAVQKIFHRVMLHEPREDGTQPLLHYNEFVEAVLRLATLRVEGGGLTADEALDFFMKSHFKFVGGGQAMEGYFDDEGELLPPPETFEAEPGTSPSASPKRAASANYNFC